MTTRPLSFDDYVGQERAKTQLRIAIGAHRRNGTSIPHICLSGNPGLGKTTLAKIIANEYGSRYHEVMASNLQTLEDIEDMLAGLTDDGNDILFIDEIHRLPMRVEELLYPVMEDFHLEVDGRRYWVPRFTLIGATTLLGDLSRPLRDRFGLQLQLQNYQVDEIVTIIGKLAERNGINIERDAIFKIAMRSKGVARIGINYFHRCKEYADYLTDGTITSEVAEAQFAVMGIDELGLDENDYRVLEYLATQSRPVGIAGLCSGCDIDQPTVTNVIEPYLVQLGLINRTRSGREITERGIRIVRGEQDIQPTVENSIESGNRVGGRARR